jgi:hypothetical protein
LDGGGVAGGGDPLALAGGAKADEGGVVLPAAAPVLLPTGAEAPPGTGDAGTTTVAVVGS